MAVSGWDAMLSYRIEREKRLVVITGAGAVTAREALDLQDAIRRDPAFDPGFALLTDYVEVAALDFSAADLKRMALNSPFGPQAVRAYVARGDLVFGLLRMYEVFGSSASQSEGLRVFRDVDAAMRWIGETRRAA
jgi:hypothetical protein